MDRNSWSLRKRVLDASGKNLYATCRVWFSSKRRTERIVN